MSFFQEVYTFKYCLEYALTKNAKIEDNFGMENANISIKICLSKVRLIYNEGGNEKYDKFEVI